MPRKAEQPTSFKTALKELKPKKVVARFESDKLPLEQEINELEKVKKP